MSYPQSHSCPCAVMNCSYLQELEQGYLFKKSDALLQLKPDHSCLMHACSYQQPLAIWLLVFGKYTLSLYLLGFFRKEGGTRQESAATRHQEQPDGKKYQWIILLRIKICDYSLFQRELGHCWIVPISCTTWAEAGKIVIFLQFCRNW